jgi:hypothetical protein
MDTNTAIAGLFPCRWAQAAIEICREKGRYKLLDGEFHATIGNCDYAWE